MAEALVFDRLPSPLGELLIVADESGRLRAIDWCDEERLRARLARSLGGAEFALAPQRDPAGLTEALRAYFAGDLAVIDTLPVEAAGTPFQRSVWAALRGIACGTTVSYGEIARRIGQPGAMRAVGLANNSNPIPIVVPCHRVIGADGALVGFGGGLDRKRWLLDHEGAGSKQLSLAI
ncbi:methylated-DNA--[protein]-cysteine S-methyltransferase [Inquilinus limosus]|uniref:Methylated-DNA--protein-cysteine methyltransferase n=1 Tax=Inquilinus limosus TaxID=171674 RepID=A0A211ZTG6_9PROT|nr:methylated-DNA--[protein]-cysteine S-methyltransferase [Inquilinus limosus]OWJ68560.1 methylated-DNA--protein-cysteine methyltransferase [Inquilinus limosus]